MVSCLFNVTDGLRDFVWKLKLAQKCDMRLFSTRNLDCQACKLLTEEERTTCRLIVYLLWDINMCITWQTLIFHVWLFTVLRHHDKVDYYCVFHTLEISVYNILSEFLDCFSSSTRFFFSRSLFFFCALAPSRRCMHPARCIKLQILFLSNCRVTQQTRAIDRYRNCLAVFAFAPIVFPVGGGGGVIHRRRINWLKLNWFPTITKMNRLSWNIGHTISSLSKREVVFREMYLVHFLSKEIALEK